jgi:MraZ protein
MFLGQMLADITEDGWLALPPVFSESLTEGLVVTRGFDGNLLLFPAQTWRVLADTLTAQPLTNPDARQLRRRLFARATTLELDVNGRIRLPNPLHEFAGLSHMVVVAGMFDHCEIWHPEAWTAVEAAAAAGGQDDRWQSLGI